ncbi:MAG TPA: nucleotidyltransferase domain-containing protein, partial [Pricia sp.]|nr:nucleotidyltransferase domain-containing protein [Pricia sp.]
MNPIEKNKTEIVALCQKHKVSKLFAFGSVLTDRFSKESDIDLVVDFDEFDKMEYADNYFNLKFSLEDLFQRNVDLLEN